MNPTTIQNVVTYDTIIEFANPDLKLFPGMTAYVTIPVATAQNALKLPNTALRYKPPISLEEIRAVYAKYGIEAVPSSRGPERAQTPSAGEKDGAPAAVRTPRDEAVVWRLHKSDNSLEPVRVSLGVTDHSFTEIVAVLQGTLKEGDDLVVRTVLAKPRTPGTKL